MAQVALASELRNDTGKGVARKLRAIGRIPGVLYGPAKDPIHLSLDEKATRTLIQSKGLNRIIALNVEGQSGDNTHLCLIKDVQRDVYQQKVLHLDLRRVDLNEVIEINVRVILEGEATVRSKGGIVEQMIRTVKVRTTPAQIPESLMVDISQMRPGQTIHVKELPVPENCEIFGNLELAILNITAARGAVIAQA